jgi:hypothetical protein
MRIKFSLKRFEIGLKDGTYKSDTKRTWISDANIIFLKIDNMYLSFDKMPALLAFK